MRKFFVLFMLCFANQFANAQWTQTNGPPGGGSIGSLIVFGDNILAGTSENGLFISTDLGTSWDQVNCDFPYYGLRSFLLAGEYVLAASDVGIFRSSDGGLSWEEANIGMPSYRSITGLAINGENIIAGTSIGSYFISENYGYTWVGVSIGQPAPSSLVVCNNVLFAGTGNGVFLSADNGSSWTEVNNGLTEHNVQTLAVKDSNIFAGTFYGGVFLSTDNGSSWKSVNTGLQDQSLVIDALTVSGTNIYAATRGGLFRSVNNGSSWTPINNGLPQFVWVRSIAAGGSKIFAGLDGFGVFVSGNNGNSWTSTAGLPCTTVHSLVFNGSTLFAGTNGLGLFKSTDNGIVWVKTGNGIPEWYNIEALAANGTTLFAGTSMSLYKSSNEGFSWTELPVPQVQDIAVYGNTILAGVYWGGVYMSTDNGSSWNQINNGLPNRPVNAVVFSGTTLFAGTDGDGIYRSTDNGNSWIPVNSGLTNKIVTSLVVKGTTIFAGTYGGMFMSNNNGSLWAQVNYGEYHSLVVIGSTILAGTYNGAYASTDNGTSWTPVNEGLTRPIYSFAFSDTNIFAGTSGNGVYMNSTFLTGTDDGIVDIYPITLFPNPASTFITIESAEEGNCSLLSIYNIIGQQVLSRNISEPLTTIDISNLPGGMYIVQCGNDHAEQTGRFLKK